MRRCVLLAAVAFSAVACKPEPDEIVGPTWYQDVAPVAREHCGSCHTDDGPAWSMDDPERAQGMAVEMIDEIRSGRMPPFGAATTDECEPVRPYANDLTLTDEQKRLFEDWAAAGAPLGDAATAAELPNRVPVDLENPDISLYSEVGFTPEGETDQFRCFSYDAGNDVQKWLTGVQIVPDRVDVVHHGLVFLDADGATAGLDSEGDGWDCFGGVSFDGDLLGAWAPGMPPNYTPPSAAIGIPAGSRLVVQIHYHPIASEDAEPDHTMVQVKWTDEEPEYDATIALLGNFDDFYGADIGGLWPDPDDRNENAPEFRIPAGNASHTETLSYTLQPGDGPARVFAVANHMHYVGTDMLSTVEHAEPVGNEAKEECLVQTPAWDFNWQRIYTYDAPIAELPELRDGDTIHLRCTYDNSMDNPAVKQALTEQGLTAPRDVYLGEETLDEMCLVGLAVVTPHVQ